MNNNPIEDRHIRVFISSTFQDMEKEREQLIKKVFPVLRKKAAQRGVTLTELDLRWGITEEESENGKVLEICLKEIDNSRPFFIGLLGDRYGWCPSEAELEKNHNIEEMFPWVRQAIAEGKSVTEMEFLYGALFPKSVSKHIDAFFWIKKSSTCSDERLERLKKIVRDNSEYPCNDYSSPEDLGAQVTAAFEEILEERFPPQRLSEIETFQLEQELYRRTLEKIYVPIEKNLSCLENFLQDDKQTVLALIGDSGSGKSATISNWLKAHSDDKNFDFIYCFLQASNKGADINSVLGYLDAELSNLLGIETQDNILVNSNNAEEVFKKHFAEATSDRNLVLILDGINILDEPNDKLLNWIPDVPDGSKIILSTLESDITYQSILRKEYYTETISLLEDNQLKTNYVKLYLGQYGKTLTEKQTQRLISSPITTTPEALRSILNELKNNGSYEELDNAIDRYAQVQDAKELYRLIIDNAGATFDEVMFSKILLTIAVSRNGLGEDTLMKLSGATQLQWSQFFCSFSEYFYTHQGLISYTNRKLQEEVLERYQDDIELARNMILDNLEYESGSMAKYLEAPYQIWKLGNYAWLNWLLSYFIFLSCLVVNDEMNLFKYWKDIRKSNLPRKRYYFHVKSNENGDFARIGIFMYLVEEFRLCSYFCIREIIKDCFLLITSKASNIRNNIYSKQALALFYLSDSLYMSKHYRLSLCMANRLINHMKRHSDLELSDYFIQMGHLVIANCYWGLGNKKKYENVYKNFLDMDQCEDVQQEAIVRAASLANAIFVYIRTDKEKAEECFLEAEMVYNRLIKDNPAFINAYIDLLSLAPTVYVDDEQKRHQYLEKALDVASEALKYGYNIQSNNMAQVYSYWATSIIANDTEKAIQYCDMALDILSSTGSDRSKASAVLVNCISVYCQTGEEVKARDAIDRLLKLPPDFSGVKYCHGDSRNWGTIYYCQGFLDFSVNPEQSEQYFKKAISAFNDLGDETFTNFYYGLANENLGRLSFGKGEYRTALEYFKCSIRVYKRIMSTNDNVDVLCHLIEVSNWLVYSHLYIGNIITASEKIKENCNRIDKVPKTHLKYYQLKASTYSTMADVLLCQDDKKSAKKIIQKALAAAKESGLGKDTIDNLNNVLENIQ